MEHRVIGGFILRVEITGSFATLLAAPSPALLLTKASFSMFVLTMQSARYSARAAATSALCHLGRISETEPANNATYSNDMKTRTFLFAFALVVAVPSAFPQGSLTPPGPARADVQSARANRVAHAEAGSGADFEPAKDC